MQSCVDHSVSRKRSLALITATYEVVKRTAAKTQKRVKGGAGRELCLKWRCRYLLLIFGSFHIVSLFFVCELRRKHRFDDLQHECVTRRVPESDGWRETVHGLPEGGQ